MGAPDVGMSGKMLAMPAVKAALSHLQWESH